MKSLPLSLLPGSSENGFINANVVRPDRIFATALAASLSTSRLRCAWARSSRRRCLAKGKSRQPIASHVYLSSATVVRSKIAALSMSGTGPGAADPPAAGHVVGTAVLDHGSTMAAPAAFTYTGVDAGVQGATDSRGAPVEPTPPAQSTGPAERLPRNEFSCG